MEPLQRILLFIGTILVIGATVYGMMPDGFFKFLPYAGDFKVTIRSNTEYYDGDSGKILTIVTNAAGHPITANCTTSILYPNESSFVTNAPMPAQSTLGSYIYDFTVPAIQGTYEYSTNCTVSGRNIIEGNSFHVSNATNVILSAIHDENVSDALRSAGINLTITQTAANTQSLVSSTFTNLSSHLDYLTTLEQNENDSNILSFLQAINSSLSQQINNLNFTLSNGSINIYVVTNDCLQGGNWLIQATVVNQFGVHYSQPPLYCNITTNNWGMSPMSYNGGLKLYQYSHVCDVVGTIAWSVDCN